MPESRVSCFLFYTNIEELVGYFNAKLRKIFVKIIRYSVDCNCLYV